MKKIERFIFALFGIIGLLLLIIGIFITFKQFNNKNKIETKAIIESIVRDSSDDYEVYVKYIVNEREYKNKLNSYSSSYYEGKEISIYYDKTNPNKIVTKLSDYLLLIIPGMGLIFFLIGSSYFVIGSIKKKKNNNLKINGMQIEVNYVETILNTSYQVNGRSPYNIVCEWNSSSDGKTYIFKSKNLWFNPENIINEKNITKFNCYVDSNNYKKYYLDTDEFEEQVIIN